MTRTLYKDKVVQTQDLASQDFDRVEYKFSNDKEYFQEELSFEDYGKIMRLFEKDIQDSLDDKADSNKFDTLDINLGFHKIADILSISLKPINKSKYTMFCFSTINKLKKTEVKTAIDDFFTLNPELTKDLTALVQNVATRTNLKEYKNFGTKLEALLQQAKVETENFTSQKQQSKKASTSSAKATSQNTKPQENLDSQKH